MAGVKFNCICRGFQCYEEKPKKEKKMEKTGENRLFFVLFPACKKTALTHGNQFCLKISHGDTENTEED